MRTARWASFRKVTDVTLRCLLRWGARSVSNSVVWYWWWSVYQLVKIFARFPRAVKWPHELSEARGDDILLRWTMFHLWGGTAASGLATRECDEQLVLGRLSRPLPEISSLFFCQEVISQKGELRCRFETLERWLLMSLSRVARSEKEVRS